MAKPLSVVIVIHPQAIDAKCIHLYQRAIGGQHPLASFRKVEYYHGATSSTRLSSPSPGECFIVRRNFKSQNILFSAFFQYFEHKPRPTLIGMGRALFGSTVKS